jgi:putative lipoic acid-binding regulatory protein
MDYREGARRIISLEEAANRTRLEASKTLTEETTARIRERMEGAKQRREGLIADFDQLRLPDRLIALNSQVWSGLGRVDTVTEDLPTPNRAYIRRHVLSAEIPLYVPDTTPVTRPGIVHIHRSGGERYFNQDNQEFGGWFKCYKVPGMKKVADRIVGAQVGHTETTALTIEIEAPTVPKNEGDRIKLRIEENKLSESMVDEITPKLLSSLAKALKTEGLEAKNSSSGDIYSISVSDGQKKITIESAWDAHQPLSSFARKVVSSIKKNFSKDVRSSLKEFLSGNMEENIEVVVSEEGEPKAVIDVNTETGEITATSLEAEEQGAQVGDVIPS